MITEEERKERRRQQCRVNTARWREHHPEKSREVTACSNAKARATGRTKAWAQANVERCRASQKRYRDGHQELTAARARKWDLENPKKRCAMAMKRKARKLQATPWWADQSKIREIYQETPPGCHVDHIIPLISPVVCGLHVPWNLQYLPARENMSKGNRFYG